MHLVQTGPEHTIPAHPKQSVTAITGAHFKERAITNLRKRGAGRFAPLAAKPPLQSPSLQNNGQPFGAPRRFTRLMRLVIAGEIGRRRRLSTYIFRANFIAFPPDDLVSAILGGTVA
jgi:hypothetical protein